MLPVRSFPRLKRHNKRKVFSLFATTLMLLGAFSVVHIPPVAGATCAPNTNSCPFGRYFDYEVFLIMENTDLSEITSAGGYMSSLMNANSAAIQYLNIVHPSEPNYLALLSGQTGPGTAGTSNTSNEDCTTTGDSGGCSAGSTPNLVDRIEGAHLTWRAYMEDYQTSGGIRSSGGCYLGVGAWETMLRDMTHSSTLATLSIPSHDAPRSFKQTQWS